MKKLLFLIFICSSLTIFAQNNFYLISYAGYNLSYPKAPFNRTSGISYNLGLGIGYNISDVLSTDINFQYNKHTLYSFSENGNPEYQFLKSYLIRWNYIILNNLAFKPYISFGLGISYFKHNLEKYNNILSLFPGFGFKYELSKNIGIRFYLEYAQLNFNYISDESLKYFPIQIGFQYNL
jgi:opacity protein-like surface antigen